MEEVGVFLIFFSALPALKKRVFGIYLFFKKIFLEYMIGSCVWCMRYSTPCLRLSKAGSIGAFMCPLRRMLRY